MDALPSNIEAEEAVLGSILIDQGKVLALQPILTPEMFHVARNGMIYAAILDLDRQGKPPDLVVLTDYLEQKGQLEEVGGPAFLTGLINATPTEVLRNTYTVE